MNDIFPVVGPYVPYPTPIEQPDLNPEESAMVNICLPVAWLPWVQGCCKALLWPGTWDGFGEEGPWYMPTEAMKLQNHLSQPQLGCPELPGGNWACEYLFYNDSDGWVVWPDQDGEWGEVDSQGWHTEIKFNPVTEEYERKLQIRVLWENFTYVNAVQIRWSGNYEFAPGGYQYRQTNLYVIGGSLIQASHVSTNPWDTAFEYSYTSFWPVYSDRIGIIAYIGRDANPDALEGFDMHVHEIAVWGIGNTPCPV